MQEVLKEEKEFSQNTQRKMKIKTKYILSFSNEDVTNYEKFLQTLIKTKNPVDMQIQLVKRLLPIAIKIQDH